MNVGDLALHTAALVVYPGALLVLGVGVAAETASRAVLGGEDGRAVLRRLWLEGGLVPLIAAGLLAALAATQLAAPFNPVSPLERNLLVAAVALAAATWLTWAFDWGRSPEGPRLALVAQVCWLVALLAPAVLSQTLRPQVLGAVVVPSQLPVKIGAGLLYLLCLPALLQLLPDLSPATDRAGRAVLWLPLCGLFASLFVGPSPDDPLGALRFLVVTLGAAGVAIGLVLLLRRLPWAAASALYLRVAPSLAGAVLVAGVLTAALR